MNWERARTPDQQEQRSQEILAAAAALFRELTYEDVSLNAIAREAGFAKSNIYRYFTSREEIFLHLYLDDFSEWADDFVEVLKTLPAETAAERLAEVWLDVLMKHERMLDLTPLLGIALERNTSEDALFHFKLNSHQLLGQIINGLMVPLPMMDAQQGGALVMRVHGLIAGLWPFTKPNETMDAVMQRPELSSFTFNIDEFLRDSIELFVRDIQLGTPS
jgi:AcrR family transcriptional regulator